MSDDTSALINAINSGFSFDIESGIYHINGGALPRMKNGQTVVGSGRSLQVGAGATAPTIIKKIGVGDLWNLSGTGTSDRCSGVKLENFGMFGDSSSLGAAIHMDYADHHRFRDLSHFGFYDATWAAKELWDTHSQGIDFDWCGTAVNKAGAVIWLKGSTTGSTNEISFAACRIESFPGQAVFIDANGTPANAPYGIYFVGGCKMESVRRSALAFVDATNDVSNVTFSDMYVGSDNLAAAQSAGPIFNVVGNLNWQFKNIRGWCDNHSATCLFSCWSGGSNLFDSIAMRDNTTMTSGIWLFNNPTADSNSFVRGPTYIAGSTTKFTGTQPAGFAFND